MSESQLPLLLTAKAAGIDEAPDPNSVGALFLLGIATAVAETVEQYRETGAYAEFMRDADPTLALPTAVKWQIWTNLQLWQEFDLEPGVTSLDALLDGALSSIAARIAEWIWSS
jgi:hypothetical protein